MSCTCCKSDSLFGKAEEEDCADRDLWAVNRRDFSRSLLNWSLLSAPMGFSSVGGGSHCIVPRYVGPGMGCTSAASVIRSSVVVASDVPSC